jgi:hypothetical protein
MCFVINPVHAAATTPHLFPLPVLVQAGPELQIQAMEHVTQRMVHAFPWAPAAGEQARRSMMSSFLARCYRLDTSGTLCSGHVNPPYM